MKTVCDTKAAELFEAAAGRSADPESCAVNEALVLARACRERSCGNAVFCRDGILQICQILEDIANGKGMNDDLALLLSLCKNMAKANDCEMSASLAAFVKSSIEDRRSEWDEHLEQRKCAHLVCPGYFTVHISPDACTGCGDCVAACKSKAIAGGEGLIHVVDNDACIRCLDCFPVCPANAFVKAGALKPRVPESPVPVGSFSGERKRRRRRGSSSDE